jgi:G3E family GTPase
VVILENEIGEVGIDDQVLENAGYEVRGMFSGCVCCTMSGELAINMGRIIRDIHPDYIIMEATGVAYPRNIKETLEAALHLDCRICCIADAKRWQRLLLPMAYLIQTQLEGADLILINKIDLVDDQTLKAVEASLRGVNGQAKYFYVSALQPMDTTIWETLRRGGGGHGEERSKQTAGAAAPASPS